MVQVVELPVSDLAWYQQGACRTIADYDSVFFPLARNGYAHARKICVMCPVLNECQEYVLEQEAGLDRQHRWGMWGALTPSQRSRWPHTATG